MKSILIITLFAFSSYNLSAQTNTKKTTTKRNTSKVKSKSTARQSSNTTTSITPAIDSFKRSNRYSPGKPYEAAPANTTSNNANTTSNNANAAATVKSNTNVNANSRNGVGQANTNTNVGSGNVVNNSNTQQNIPTSPSNEPNRADINQRPINENSKNAISDMNSSQVNALNQNQMAPPPQNWGNNQSADNKWGRNTIGESQWTPTSTIASSFTRDFPNVSGATWSRDVRDTTNYSARYKTGDYWTTSTYNTSGSRIGTRTELPLNDLPRPLLLYSDKQRASNLQLEHITRIEQTGKPVLYEVRLNSGRVVYMNGDGVERGL